MSFINLRPVLDWIYSWAANYGWAIVIFTILIRMVMLPLDIKSRKGMIKMQQLQPKIAELQRKYGNDQQKLQQKQMQLFRDEHYSPFSGCLPMLITWPIFIIMFNAMRGVSNEQLITQLFAYILGEPVQPANWLWVKNLWIADSPFSAVAPTLQSFQGITAEVWRNVVGAFSPERIETIAAGLAGYLETLQPEQLTALIGESDVMTYARNLLSATGGLADAQISATLKTLIDAAASQPAYAEAMAKSVTNIPLLFATLDIYRTPNGYLILPVLAVASQLLMTKFSGMNQQPANAQQNAGSQQNAQQQQSESMNKFMKYFLPVFTGWICLTSSASFAVYWVTSNIVAGVSNYAITKYFENKKPAAAVKNEVTK